MAGTYQTAQPLPAASSPNQCSHPRIESPNRKTHPPSRAPQKVTTDPSLLCSTLSPFFLLSPHGSRNPGVSDTHTHTHTHTIFQQTPLTCWGRGGRWMNLLSLKVMAPPHPTPDPPVTICPSLLPHSPLLWGVSGLRHRRPGGYSRCCCVPTSAPWLGCGPSPRSERTRCWSA